MAFCVAYSFEMFAFAASIVSFQAEEVEPVLLSYWSQCVESDTRPAGKDAPSSVRGGLSCHLSSFELDEKEERQPWRGRLAEFVGVRTGVAGASLVALCIV